MPTAKNLTGGQVLQRQDKLRDICARSYFWRSNNNNLRSQGCINSSKSCQPGYATSTLNTTTTNCNSCSCSNGKSSSLSLLKFPQAYNFIKEYNTCQRWETMVCISKKPSINHDKNSSKAKQKSNLHHEIIKIIMQIWQEKVTLHSPSILD